jgi:hypothetical protein
VRNLRKRQRQQSSRPAHTTNIDRPTRLLETPSATAGAASSECATRRAVPRSKCTVLIAPTYNFEASLGDAGRSREPRHPRGCSMPSATASHARRPDSAARRVEARAGGSRSGIERCVARWGRPTRHGADAGKRARWCCGHDARASCPAGSDTGLDGERRSRNDAASRRPANGG